MGIPPYSSSLSCQENVEVRLLAFVFGARLINGAKSFVSAGAGVKSRVGGHIWWGLRRDRNNFFVCVRPSCIIIPIHIIDRPSLARL